MAKSLRTYHDRTMLVPPNHVVRSGWVDIHRIRLACDTRMSVGDVSDAYAKVLHNGAANGAWPPPFGEWDREEEGVFILLDGRHEMLARLMHGQKKLFIAWLEEVPHGG